MNSVRSGEILQESLPNGQPLPSGWRAKNLPEGFCTQQRPFLEIMRLRKIAHGQESSRRASMLVVRKVNASDTALSCNFGVSEKGVIRAQSGEALLIESKGSTSTSSQRFIPTLSHAAFGSSPPTQVSAKELVEKRRQHEEDFQTVYPLPNVSNPDLRAISSPLTVAGIRAIRISR